MSVLHYDYYSDHGAACGRDGRRVTEDMDLVECKHCLKCIPIIEDARAERARLEQVALDCDAAGLRWVYDSLSTETASERMLREMVGAISKYILETREPVAA